MGCDAPSYRDPFRATGETIAMSGGNGGAAAACFTCHGLEGEGDGEVSPRLAGLDPGYLHRQLDDYANGRREHEAMRRSEEHTSKLQSLMRISYAVFCLKKTK